jgi:hypothetical protein
MQTAVRDRSAIRFTERLYRRIAQGDPIEAAVSQARIALRAGQADTLDWAVPVLFVRGQSGAIAETASPESSKPWQPPAAESPAKPTLPARLTTIYQRDVGIQVIGDVGRISRDEEGKKQ